MTGIGGKVNCNIVPVYVVKAQEENTLRAALILGLGTRENYVVSLKFRQFYPGEGAFCIHSIGR